MRIRLQLEVDDRGNIIPTAVVETLISTTKASVAPLRRYHRLRKRVLGLSRYYLFDSSVPLVESFDRKYYYDEARPAILASVAPLGEDYQRKMERAISGR